MRQLAWLNTTPEGFGSPRRDVVGEALPLDELESLEALYLVEYLLQAGPTMMGGPLTHTEIAAWQANSGIRLNTWESQTMRQLSIDYLNEMHAANEITSPAPFGGTALSNKVVAAQMRESVRKVLTT